MRRTLLGVFALVAPTWIDAASAQSAAPALAPLGPPYAVAGELAGGRPGEEARDISGVACLPSAGSAPKRCLVVNDENRTAQFVTLDAGTVVPGEEVTLIGTEPSETTLGRAPTFETCPKNEVEFSDLDGEGVAYAAPYFYVVGSHGCSRKGAFRLSSFILARFRVDADGAPVGPDGEALPAGVQPPIETTYRLSDLFRSAPALRPFFGKGLDERSNGLNLEGIAVIGDRLFAGLRAPSVSGKAFLVEASVADLFAPGRDPAQAAPVVIPLALGEASGIRDLACPTGVFSSSPDRRRASPFRRACSSRNPASEARWSGSEPWERPPRRTDAASRRPSSRSGPTACSSGSTASRAAARAL